METIARQLTGVGRSAIAVIEVVGEDAGQVIGNHFQQATPLPLQPGQIRYGTWKPTNAHDAAGESIVITPIGQSHYEIHCHGGPASVNAILSDLESSQATVAQFSELSAGAKTQTNSKSWATDTKPLLIQEAEAVLIHCTTVRTAVIAMDQVRGELHHWATESLNFISPSRAAGGSDVSADTSAAVPAAGEGIAATIQSIRDQAAEILAHAPFTTRLTRPFNVVLLGAPNVGKSSLTNAILGYTRSITTPTPGTTRDILHAETVIDGIPIRLSDTAGIRQSDDAIEQEGSRRAIEELQSADLIIQVRDPNTVHVGAKALAAHPKSSLNTTPTLNILNKSDLLTPAGAKALAAHPSGPIPRSANASTPTFSVSATSGQGIPDLLAAITTNLIPTVPSPGAPAAINDRQANQLQAIATASDAPSMRHSLSQLQDATP